MAEEFLDDLKGYDPFLPSHNLLLPYSSTPPANTRHSPVPTSMATQTHSVSHHSTTNFSPSASGSQNANVPEPTQPKSDSTPPWRRKAPAGTLEAHTLTRRFSTRDGKAPTAFQPKQPSVDIIRDPDSRINRLAKSKVEIPKTLMSTEKLAPSKWIYVNGVKTDGKTNPKKYGCTLRWELGLCFKTFFTYERCEEGERCPWRHKWFDDVEYVFLEEITKGTPVEGFLEHSGRCYLRPKPPVASDKMVTLGRSRSPPPECVEQQAPPSLKYGE
ncbi:hypothetical protein BU24DRAFT_497091 [Aaosphaeria arxii CBS 175.79]|uniref:C3H1-type domain-containing protein n=1 Tax=Aaosphaeria arxii CBS 175.79 TaxID=1450172 RepID=A0A6A5X9M0_9PLEO|nr:uncharacterized protein BU24DRAFT_497091 [Aaosphaeria arxii CBS 175.79]KAF2009467.1 hypothetical protein BU24DRAFT_497091 [Aaosphaeria arxii CBS 175.79]